MSIGFRGTTGTATRLDGSEFKFDSNRTINVGKENGNFRLTNGSRMRGTSPMESEGSVYKDVVFDKINGDVRIRNGVSAESKESQDSTIHIRKNAALRLIKAKNSNVILSEGGKLNVKGKADITLKVGDRNIHIKGNRLNITG